MFEAFIGRKFHGKSLKMIQQANDIIKEYQTAGFTLTLRQLYYQFVARDLIKNNQRSYDSLGTLISDARLAGLVDWSAIEDRTRMLRGHRTFESPAECIEDAANEYRIDMWKDQTRRVEVWIEKDALLGVVETVCRTWDVNYFACRGYASQSELYMAGKRIAARRRRDRQDTLILHAGDHDPSGQDMTRDNQDRLSLFAGGYVDVRRIALNMPQITEYDLPENPTKLSDSRAEAYIREYGESSWELDALSPKVIADLIEENIREEIDFDLWEARVDTFDKDMLKLADAVEWVNESKE